MYVAMGPFASLFFNVKKLDVFSGCIDTFTQGLRSINGESYPLAFPLILMAFCSIGKGFKGAVCKF